MSHRDVVNIWVTILYLSLTAGGGLLLLVAALRAVAIRNCDDLDSRRLMLFRLLGALVALAVLGVLAAGVYIVLNSSGGD